MNQLTPKELRKWIEEGRDYMLVDLRESWERERFNIGGLHIPMGELVASIAGIPKEAEVVLYCEKGIRSVIAAQRMEQAGFYNLYNLSGGMQAWIASLQS